MSDIFVNVKVNEAVKVWSGAGVLSHLVHVGDCLALSLPSDKEQRKEALFWLATQLENEARKL